MFLIAINSKRENYSYSVFIKPNKEKNEKLTIQIFENPLFRGGFI